jgi:hypothetical protein
MKHNFKLLRKNIDVTVVLSELSHFLQRQCWSDLRAKNISYHKKTRHVSLREHKINRANDTVQYYRNSGHIITVSQTAPYFVKTFDLLKIFEKELGGQLERVMLVALEGKSKVEPHIDEGTYYIERDRYHLVLKTDTSINFCGDENQIYNAGELWWFDNKKLHSVENKSEETRIHLIFDILKKKKSLKRKITDTVESIIFKMIAKLI